MEEPDKYEVIVSGQKRKLVIKNCDPKKDRGRYECKCGVSTTSTSLSVKPALKFGKRLEDLEGVEEETVELAVEVTKPNQRCKWTRNGRVLNPNEEQYQGRYNVVSEGCLHKLTIKNLKLKDAAEYSVNVDELLSKCVLTVKECKLIEHSALLSINY